MKRSEVFYVILGKLVGLVVGLAASIIIIFR